MLEYLQTDDFGQRSMPVNDNNLMWVDLEMTGLDPDTDTVIEIATVCTDAELNILAEGPVCAIQTDSAYLDKMDDWNVKHHTESGLVARIKESQISNAGCRAANISLYG